MKRDTAKGIIDLIQKSESILVDRFKIEDKKFEKYLYRFHLRAKNRENRENLGTFLFRQISSKTAYWFLFIEWNPNHGFYLIVYPEKRTGPLIEIHKVSNKNLQWKYSPAKRDGKNIDRKEYFKKYFQSTDVEISIPENFKEVEDFIQEIFQLTENRLKSDSLDEVVPLERIGFPEGKRVERKHHERERDSKLIQLVKEKFKRENGKLFCQLCKFDFEVRYGERGIGFIEAHHTRPLSELDNDGRETTMEEIALVCSNCHRIIHRVRPWLKMEELSKILK